MRWVSSSQDSTILCCLETAVRRDIELEARTPGPEFQLCSSSQQPCKVRIISPHVLEAGWAEAPMSHLQTHLRDQKGDSWLALVLLRGAHNRGGPTKLWGEKRERQKMISRVEEFGRGVGEDNV